MNSNIGNKIKRRNEKNPTLGKEKDKVYTPNDVAIDCIVYTLPFLKASDILYEPFKGKGGFYNNFPETNPKIWSEIDDGKDFLLDDRNFDWIITNPPYSIFNKIIDKICNANIGFCLLVNGLTITPVRLEKINQKGFYISFIYFFTISGWFGRQYYYIFEKRKDKKNLLELVYRRLEYPKVKLIKI